MIWATLAILAVATWAVGLSVLIRDARHPGADPVSDERWTEQP